MQDKEWKAVLIDDKVLPDDSKEYVYPHSKLTHFKENVKMKAVSALLKTPVVSKYLNRVLTNKAASSGTNRPYQFSCKTDYTSYDSLTDYSYYGRHLSPATKEYLDSLPDLEEVRKLFGRTAGDVQTMCPKSTMLFPTFAQHLVDSFIVTAIKGNDENGVVFDWRKTGSPHDIGLLPLYGKSIAQTTQLRLKSEEKGMKGKLKFQIIKNGEWSPFLYDAKGNKKQEFSELPDPEGLEFALSMDPTLNEAMKNKKKSTVFALGGSRANLTPNIVAWNTLLLREHNSIASKIEAEHPEWDDERVFQTARNVNLAIYLRLVIEEYINHITAFGADFTVEPGKWMWDAPWYKRNWISAEFAVLYRWHAVIPNCMKWGKKTLPTAGYLYNNGLLLDEDGMNGDLREAFINISAHRATSMEIHNSEAWMTGRDKRAIEMSRACELKSFTNYCGYLTQGQEVPKTFADITSNKEVQKELEALYGKVENVEFWVGLIAKDHPTEAIMSAELTKFVANDAFNQALTHPLLSEHVWSNPEATFSKVGFEMVAKVPTIKDMLQRNTNGGAPIEGFVGMTNPNYKIPLSEITRNILIAIFLAVGAVGYKAYTEM